VSELFPDPTLAAPSYRVAHLLEAERGMIYRPCLSILGRGDGLFGMAQLLTKRGGPFTAKDTARLQKFLRLPGTILGVCCRAAHLG
jgi:hypothetical protein